MKLFFKDASSGKNITLPEKVIAKLDSASDIDVRTILYLAAAISQNSEAEASGEIDVAEISEKIGCTQNEVEMSIAFWRGAGVLTLENGTDKGKRKVVKEKSVEKEEATHEKDGEKKVQVIFSDDMPHYTGEEIERLCEERAGLKNLIDECQRLVGKVFNQTEANKIIALSDYLKLDDAYILLIFSYCKSIGKNSVHYAVKTAFSLYNEGVDTPEMLEDFIRIAESKNSLISKLRSLLGIGARKLTKKETDFVDEWARKDYDFSLIERAYEITIDNTGNASLPYMNKILMSWQEQGLGTIAEVDKALASYKAEKQKSNAQKGDSSFDTDEFFKIALEKSYSRAKERNG